MGQRSPSCNCCGCLKFTDGYDPSPSPLWDVISGSMTLTTHTGYPAVELSEGTLAIVSGKQIAGSGGITVRHFVPSDGKLGVVFGYLDEDNYNLVEHDGTQIGTAEITQYHEMRAGSMSQVGAGGNASAFQPLNVCWATSEDHSGLVKQIGSLDAFRGMSNMPGSQFGLLCREGTAKVWRQSFDGSDWFRAFEDVDDCACNCEECVLNATSPAPPTMEALIQNMPIGSADPATCQIPNGLQLCGCEVPCEFTAIHTVATFPSREIVTRIKLHQSGSDYYLTLSIGLAAWTTNLGASIPQLWTVDHTFTAADLIANGEPCDMTYATIRVKARAVEGMVL